MADLPPTPEPGRARHASILDVATLAGVSAATVSRSLRGHANVAPATRQRVVDAARELSYVASPTASGLASGQTHAVGMVVPFVTRWFFATAVAGACDTLGEAGYDVLLYHLGSADARDRFFDRMPLARRVDAVLTLSLPLTDEHTLSLRALDMPLVSLGARLPGVASVRIDDVAAARRAVNHLIHQGHERIGYIAGRDDRKFGFASSGQRRAGFDQALREAGLDAAGMTASGTYGTEGGLRAMEEILAGSQLPTAIVAEYDEMAIGAMRTLRRAGIGVPDEVSVVGIDDHEMAFVADLTTVAQPVREEGALAAQLLLDALDGKGDPSTDVVLPTRLVVRGSTSPPAARRAALRRRRRAT